MRKLIDTILSTPSLALLTGAAGSFFATVAADNPALLLGMIGFLSGWLVYLQQALGLPARRGAIPSDRANTAAAYREALDEAIPPRTVPQQHVREHMYRRDQLDRIFKLERHIVEANANTPGGISVATPEVLLEVHDLANQAVELAMRRVGLLRALRSTSEQRLTWEYNAILQRLGQVGGSAQAELRTLLASKGEQIAAYRRLGDELTITEAQLDSIETFLNTLSYDQSITVGSVNSQISSLKEQIAARRQAAEDVRRVVAEAGRPPTRSASGGA